MTAEFKTQGDSPTPDNLLAGEFPRVERLVTVASGADLAKGAVLGRITASGKYKLSASAAVDGSETPDAVLAEAANAASADVQAVVYFSGEFNENALVLGAGHTVDAVRLVLRAKSLFLRKNQKS